jgi:hypothetical protein
MAAGPTNRSRIGHVHNPWLVPVLAVLSALTFVGVLVLTSYKNFYYDEWDFVSSNRQWDLKLLFLPHNEHWSTIPILVWKLLFLVFGLRSHLPYEAALLAVHLVSVWLLFMLIRRRSGDLPAFAGALTLLVLGSGGTNIVWAFQIGFVGSVAFGLLAMLLLEGDPSYPGRIAPVSAALLCSLMCSGVGLAFLAAVGAELLVDGRRRRFLIALVVPTVAFAAWFLEFGAGLPGTLGAPCPTCVPSGFSADIHKGPIGMSYLVSLAGFVAFGLESAVSGLFGLTSISPVLVAAVAVLLLFHWVRQRKVQRWQLGLAAGAVGWYVLTGLGRIKNGPATAGDPHYLYVGVALVLPMVVDAFRELPWRGLWRPALTIAFAVVLLGNLLQLRDSALNQTDLMRVENAELQTVEAFRGAPDMALDQGIDPVIMPQLRARAYFAAIDELGSPVPHVNSESLRQLPGDAVDRVMVNLFANALTVTADPSRSTEGMPCQDVDSASGATLLFRVHQGQWLMLQPTKGGDAFLSLGFINQPPAEPLQHLQLTAATQEWIHLPNTGKATVWQLQVETLAVGLVRVCSTSRLEFDLRPANVYVAEARSFTFGPGWSAVSDPAASGGRSLRAASGTPKPVGSFGSPFVPAPVAYDIWFRVRVSRTAGTTPEMIFALTDVTANDYVASKTFRSSEASTTYGWLLVASDVAPPSGHLVRFQTNITARLSADWFVDTALMVPSGSPPPGA